MSTVVNKLIHCLQAIHGRLSSFRPETSLSTTPRKQSLYFFSHLGSRRRWEEPAVDSHFSPVAFSAQESLISRSSIRIFEPQATTFDHSSMGVTESMTRIVMSGGTITGDRDTIRCPNGVVAAFVHKSSTSSSALALTSIDREGVGGAGSQPRGIGST